jgi:pimeloyl-ACP methyl ester carboxylesterase
VIDFALQSGRIRAERWGDPGAPLVLCVHGLTANLKAFSWLAEGLVRSGRQVVAIDCRGRGRSEVTPPGSYGLDAHASDVLSIVEQLNAGRFSYIGWSMGALIGMAVAARAGASLQQLIMLDHVGPMDPEATALVEASLDRLDAIVDTPEQYIDAIRSRSVVDPWTPFWSRVYGYELARRDDGRWAPTTSKAACAEDLSRFDRDWSELWRAVEVPTTLVRCNGQLAGTLLLSEAHRDQFTAAVTDVTVVETDTNHYTVMTDPATLAGAVAALRDR